ncbi:MAG: hypothetical protein LBH82_03040, partial [Bacteroidales bacterium]|nr:hypothetical protein [Bacteroidales bacterium]
MKKSVIFILLSLVFLSASAQYAGRWEKVDKLAKQQLPESALKEVESIFAEARKAENFNETVKAYIYKMRFTLVKNPDDAPSVIDSFQHFAAHYTAAEQRALLHSMAAELYSMYYSSERYSINRRSQVVDYLPDDIRLWSKNLFFDRISEELRLSLQDTDTLQTLTVKCFKPLITAGDNLQQTLFDFLADRAIMILGNLHDAAMVKNPLRDTLYFLPAELFINIVSEEKYKESAESKTVELYRMLLDFYRKTNNIQALIDVDISRLKYVKEHSESVKADDWYRKSLELLCETYGDRAEAVPVLAEMAGYYYTQSERGDTLRKKAYDIAQSGIKRFPKSPSGYLLQNILLTLEQKSLRVMTSEVASPASELVFLGSVANISRLEMKIYRVDATAEEYDLFKHNEYKWRAYPKRTLVKTEELEVPVDETFYSTEIEWKITTGTYGIYEFTIEEKGNKEAEQQASGNFIVTDFTFIQRKIAQDERNVYVLHRITGQQIGGVEVNAVS